MTDRFYYILDTTTPTTQMALWWRPERRGYTENLNLAGRYPEEEARAIEKMRPCNKAVLCELADALSQRVVYRGTLP